MVLQNKRVLVLGLGESGQAMARWCVCQGACVTVADTREQPAGLSAFHEKLPGVPVLTGPQHTELLDGFDMVAVSPGLDPRQGLVAEAYQRQLPVVGEVQLFVDALQDLQLREQCKIIAITGTNGKTTTTTLCEHIGQVAGLDAVAAGNISPAMLTVLCDRLEAGKALPSLWVLELSSFQLETVDQLGADAATILNVTEDHLDRYQDLAGYSAAKQRIYHGAGTVVANRDDAATLPAQGAYCSFGLNAPAQATEWGVADQQLAQGEIAWLPRTDLRLSGQHNVANALAAMALCAAVGIERSAIVKGIQSFNGLAHRVETVAVRSADQVDFIDDSKGTNVGATVAALQGLQRKVVLIAGGDGKGQDFAPLREPIREFARAVVLIGRDAPAINDVLAESNIPRVPCDSLEEAVAVAGLLAQPEDAVLLSPACASLDMFRSYAHRAEVFLQAALALPGVSRV